jgi:hypothetical protein
MGEYASRTMAVASFLWIAERAYGMALNYRAEVRLMNDWNAPEWNAAVEDLADYAARQGCEDQAKDIRKKALIKMTAPPV